MLRLRLIILCVVTAAFVSCKCHKDAATTTADATSKTTAANDTLMRFVVSFYSIGSGSEFSQVEKLKAFITDFRKQAGKEVSYETAPWGREGEVDYCFPLKDLTADQQKDFIGKAKAVLADAKWVHYFENEPCKNKVKSH